MAKLNKYHDVSVFCADKALESGAPIDHAKFDAQTRTLVACDGRIGIAVPVTGECDAPNGLIPKARLSQAAEKEQELSGVNGEMTLDEKGVKPNHNAEIGKYPNLFGVIDSSEPDVVIPLSLETLGPLVDYSRQHSAGGIYLCVHHTPGDKWQKRRVKSAIQFFFDVKQEDKSAEPVQAVGALMPCSIEDQDAVHSRLRAALSLVNSGKSPKEKAAEARQKAVSRKAAQAEALAANDKRRKAAKPEPEEDEHEDEDEPVVIAVHEGNGKAKPVNGQANPKVATPKEPREPKTAKPSRNGDAPAVGVADLLTRAQASLSRHKFAAARRYLNTARTEIEAGNGSSELLAQVDKLDLRISKEKAAFKRG
ncbi:MAG: hypothetical protein ACYC3X_29395 [Pirellulaceae bacterium]